MIQPFYYHAVLYPRFGEAKKPHTCCPNKPAGSPEREACCPGSLPPLKNTAATKPVPTTPKKGFLAQAVGWIKDFFRMLWRDILFILTGGKHPKNEVLSSSPVAQPKTPEAASVASPPVASPITVNKDKPPAEPEKPKSRSYSGGRGSSSNSVSSGGKKSCCGGSSAGSEKTPQTREKSTCSGSGCAMPLTQASKASSPFVILQPKKEDPQLAPTEPKNKDLQAVPKPHFCCPHKPVGSPERESCCPGSKPPPVS